jgi:hypothetical protein
MQFLQDPSHIYSEGLLPTMQTTRHTARIGFTTHNLLSAACFTRLVVWPTQTRTHTHSHARPDAYLHLRSMSQGVAMPLLDT